MPRMRLPKQMRHHLIMTMPVLLAYATTPLIAAGSSDRLCSTSELRKGHWSRIHGITSVPARFPCVEASSKEQKTHVHSFSIKPGRHEPVEMFGSGCSDRCMAEPKRDALEGFTWVPDIDPCADDGSCLFAPWSANAFCGALGDRTMMLLGDSTMGQFASTLVNMLVVAGGGGACAHQLKFEVSDTLTGQMLGGWNRGKSWHFIKDSLERRRQPLPDIVVMSVRWQPQIYIH